jgi:hypothetical protein
LSNFDENKMANSKPWCKKDVFDAYHLADVGRWCPKRHKMYRWEATGACVGTLISDSLCKRLMKPRNFIVQSVPGLGLESAYNKIRDGTFEVLPHEFTLLSVGTNDLHTLDLHQLRMGYEAVVSQIRQQSPFTTIGITSIIPRPCDEDDSDEWTRRGINTMISRFCRANGLDYSESWTQLTNDDESPKVELYAKDLLHLKDSGVERLRLHFEGFIASMQETKYRNE